jgi:hypothetical protein
LAVASTVASIDTSQRGGAYLTCSPPLTAAESLASSAPRMSAAAAPASRSSDSAIACSSALIPALISVVTRLKVTTAPKNASTLATPEMLALPSTTPSAAHVRPHCSLMLPTASSQPWAAVIEIPAMRPPAISPKDPIRFVIMLLTRSLPSSAMNSSVDSTEFSPEPGRA